MPSNFSVDELSTALQEISDWGLQSKQPFQILPAQLCPKDEARAKVELLEDGDSAVIGLSEKGWRIALRTVADPRRLPAENADKDDATFETLEHLLAYLSPQFERKRMEELSSKLEAISKERQ